MKDSKYTITNIVTANPNGAGCAPREFHPCTVLVQPPNAVTRSRREYHYYACASWLADCHICNYSKMVIAQPIQCRGAFSVELGTDGMCLFAYAAHWALSKSSRHLSACKNTFVKMCFYRMINKSISGNAERGTHFRMD